MAILFEQGHGILAKVSIDTTADLSAASWFIIVEILMLRRWLTSFRLSSRIFRPSMQTKSRLSFSCFQPTARKFTALPTILPPKRSPHLPLIQVKVSGSTSFSLNPPTKNHASMRFSWHFRKPINQTSAERIIIIAGRKVPRGRKLLPSRRPFAVKETIKSKGKETPQTGMIYII